MVGRMVSVLEFPDAGMPIAADIVSINESDVRPHFQEERAFQSLVLHQLVLMRVDSYSSRSQNARAEFSNNSTLSNVLSVKGVTLSRYYYKWKCINSRVRAQPDCDDDGERRSAHGYDRLVYRKHRKVISK
jgi:hypothetical protein